MMPSVMVFRHISGGHNKGTSGGSQQGHWESAENVDM
jgi:hypothetical protein